MGYRICHGYYKEVFDNKRVVHGLLNFTDYPAFLARSRCAEKLAAGMNLPGN